MDAWLSRLAVVHERGARPIAPELVSDAAEAYVEASLNVVETGAATPQNSDGECSWHWPGGLHVHQGSSDDRVWPSSGDL